MCGDFLRKSSAPNRFDEEIRSRRRERSGGRQARHDVFSESAAFAILTPVKRRRSALA